MGIASELGDLRVPDGGAVDLKQMENLPDDPTRRCGPGSRASRWRRSRIANGDDKVSVCDMRARVQPHPRQRERGLPRDQRPHAPRRPRRALGQREGARLRHASAGELLYRYNILRPSTSCRSTARRPHRQRRARGEDRRPGGPRRRRRRTASSSTSSTGARASTRHTPLRPPSSADRCPGRQAQHGDDGVPSPGKLVTASARSAEIAPGFRCNQIPFVDRDHECTALALDQIGDAQVLLLEPVLRIDHQHYDLGETKPHAAARPPPKSLPAFLDPRAPAQACRIENVKFAAVPVDSTEIESRVAPASALVNSLFLANRRSTSLLARIGGRRTTATRIGRSSSVPRPVHASSPSNASPASAGSGQGRSGI